MPTIPDSRDLGRRVIPQSRRAIVQDRSGEIEATAVQNAANTIGQAVDYVEKRRDQFNYATAKSGLLKADIEARQELEEDPDWATYETRYREKMGKAREQVAGSIKDRRDCAMFDQESAIDIERGAFDVRRAARGKEVDWGRATLEETLAANHQAAWKAPDEASRSAIINASSELIDGAIAKGYVKQEEAGTVRRKFTAEYARGAIDMMSTEDAIAALTNPKKGTPGYFLEEPVRVAMREQLIKEQKREREAAENRALIMEQRRDAAIQRAQRNAADQAWQHVAAGGTVSTVPKEVWRGMDGRDQIAMQDRERERAKGEKVETDRDAYYGLLALSTDPERADEWKSTDLRRYKLNDSDFEFFAKRQLDAPEKGADLDAMSEDKQISLAVADLKLTDKAWSVLFERSVRAEIGAEQKRVGRKLNPEERQQVIDRQMIEGEIPGGEWWRNDTEAPLYKIPEKDRAKFVPDAYGDIPAEEKKKIEEALTRAGRPVNPTTITDLWNRKQ